MRKVSYLLVVSLVTLGVSTAAMAQGANTIGILTLGDPVTPGDPLAFDGINPNYKTPPMQSSSQITLFIGGHIGTTMTNFMGGWWSVHTAPGAPEIGLLVTASLTGPLAGSATAAITLPATSSAVQGHQFLTTALLGATVPPSGITLVPSDAAPLGAVIIHAINTTPALNSDIDLTIVGKGIFHVPKATVSSGWLTLFPSDSLYATSNWTPGLSELPSIPPEIGFGHWVHLDQTKQFHLMAGSGSWFYTRLLGTGFVGIEHVPEPMTAGLLLGCGCVALLGGRTARRRRLARS